MIRCRGLEWSAFLARAVAGALQAHRILGRRGQFVPTNGATCVYVRCSTQHQRVESHTASTFQCCYAGGRRVGMLAGFLL